MGAFTIYCPLGGALRWHALSFHHGKSPQAQASHRNSVVIVMLTSLTNLNQTRLLPKNPIIPLLCEALIYTVTLACMGIQSEQESWSTRRCI